MSGLPWGFANEGCMILSASITRVNPYILIQGFIAVDHGRPCSGPLIRIFMISHNSCLIRCSRGVSSLCYNKNGGKMITLTGWCSHREYHIISLVSVKDELHQEYLTSFPPREPGASMIGIRRQCLLLCWSILTVAFVIYLLLSSPVFLSPPGLICLTAVSSTGLYCQVDYHVQHISLFLEYLLRLTFLWWIYFFILFWPYPFRPDHYPLWPTTPLVVLLLLYLISALPFLFANYFSFPVDSPSVSTYFLFRIK